MNDKKLDWDEPIRTKSGKHALLLTRLGCNLKYPNIVNVSGQGDVISYNRFGEPQSPYHESYALENVPEEPGVFYVNVYPGHFGGIYDSRTDADKDAGKGRTACIRYEEGRFDD